MDAVGDLYQPIRDCDLYLSDRPRRAIVRGRRKGVLGQGLGVDTNRCPPVMAINVCEHILADHMAVFVTLRTGPRQPGCSDQGAAEKGGAAQTGLPQ
jgi:hypothetical protein